MGSPQQQQYGGLHAVLLSAPEHGHLNPFLQLALHLSSRGATVTVVSTPDGLNSGKAIRPAAQQHPHIRFAALALDEPQDPSEADSHVDRVLTLFSGLETHGPPQLERIIGHGLNHNRHDGRRRVSCLISDFFFPWAGEVARKCEVMWCMFWPSSASMLYNCILDANKLAMEEGEVSEDCFDTPGFPFLKDHAGGLAINKRFCRYLIHPTKAMKKLDYVIMNTLDELEKEALSAMPLSARVLTVGPLFYGVKTENGHGKPQKESADSDISWLDKQERNSVLYISFGSWVRLQGEQLEQLALGVEASGSSFLWVVKPNEVPQLLKGFMEGFVERNTGKGLIVEWASQEMVLGHQAVGAFLTHCGWNSVLEAVTMGVPMVCCPILGDQFRNRSVVEQQLKIGRGIDMRKLQANEVTSVVKDVMADEGMRHRATQVGHATRDTVQPGGLSYQNLEAFLNGVTQV